jgi:dihydroflavonol-4-reductase
MKVLVIGASGHLGAHLARVLLAEGYAVRALVRPGSDTRGLAGLPLETVRGDVLDRASLAAALRGCQSAFHLAAPTSLTPELSRIVVEGTRNVLEESLRAGLERLVYTSSVATIGYARRPAVLDERSNEFTRASAYHVSKWQAEREALDFGHRTGLPVVVLNPATIVGPLDYRVTPSNAPLRRCLDRGLPCTFDSGLTVVHAEDVARGHVLALRRGTPGERYILGGDRMTIREYFKLLCELCGRPAPRLHLPRAALLTAGAAFSMLRVLGWRGVPFTFTQAWHLAGCYGWYASDKAAGQLGYHWRPVREAAAGYIDWVRSRAEEAPAGKVSRAA